MRSSPLNNELTDTNLVSTPTVTGVAPTPKSHSSYEELMDAALRIEKKMTMENYATLFQSIQLSVPPPKVLPCANIRSHNNWACPNAGTKVCSSCKLVSYCSKECQATHWRRHKLDCKNELRSPDWKPDPVSMQNFFHLMQADESEWKSNPFNMGIALWGNVPATDILRLDHNEKDETRDFNLAFVASGDLRNLVSTINALPETYSGKLTIILNDHAPWVVSRNITLLLILTRISDPTLAADIALHFWYSIFLPTEYRLQYLSILGAFMDEFTPHYDQGAPFITLVERCRATFRVNYLTLECLGGYGSLRVSVEDAKKEYNRVREAPSRKEHRDTMYSGLRPSHRVAFKQYRRFGLILPHGAMNAHFNSVNTSLFGPKGQWLQPDYADPIGGWDLDTVIRVGKKYGAQPEDIYGCFYFMISEQLNLFAQRLRTFSITIHVGSFDAIDLASRIQANDSELVSLGINSKMKFDRIHVSNIIDKNYVGIERVLSAWSPLLSTSRHATILGYFMNWFNHLSPAECVACSKDKFEEVLMRLIREGKVPIPTGADLTSMSMEAFMRFMISLPLQTIAEIHAYVDTSPVFRRYLKAEKFSLILRRLRLKSREKHRIIPKRILAPVDGDEKSIPRFPNDDSAYFNTRMTCNTWTERMIEIVKA